MLVTTPDSALAALLCSETLLLERWRDAAREVMVLLQILRAAAPTLADVLAVGLIILASAPVVGAGLVLEYRRASFTVLGRRSDGSEVSCAVEGWDREITHLEVRGVCVAGQVPAAR